MRRLKGLKGLSRVGTTVVIAAAALAIPAAMAHAGELSLSDTIYNGGATPAVQYVAAPGEVNSVAVHQTSQSEITLTDTSPITLAGGGDAPPCTVLADTATCTLANYYVFLGDGDDTATINSDVVIGNENSFYHRLRTQAILAGEAGNDTLAVNAPANEQHEPLSDPNAQDYGIMMFGDSLRGAIVPFDPPPVIPVDPPGNDKLNGSAANDQMYGGPGDDIEIGGDGRDEIDATLPGNLAAGAPLPAYFPNGNSGNDDISGGPGLEYISDAEAFDGRIPAFPDAPDKTSCGTGGETPATGDYVEIGTGDTVDDDCEGVTAIVSCPAGGAACTGSSVVTATPEPGGKLASIARKGKKKAKKHCKKSRKKGGKKKGGKKKGKKATVAKKHKKKKKKKCDSNVLGSTPFSVPAGGRQAISVRLNPQIVARLLSTRNATSATQTVAASNLATRQSPFTLSK